MRHLGSAELIGDELRMPAGFAGQAQARVFEVYDVGGEILLTVGVKDRCRLDRIDRLIRRAVDEHKDALDELSQ